MERILTYPEALAEVLRHADGLSPPPGTEAVPLLETYGRVLARPVVADRDQPPFSRSTRDGFTLRSADLLSDAPTLRLVGTLRAGEPWTGPSLQAGEAIEIMTGAPVPPGADAVLMLEHSAPAGPATLQPESGRRLAPGENVVPAGAEARAGAALISPGRVVHTPEISLAASCGLAMLEVFCRPTVSIIATGDELIELDTPPAPWQIRNSNSYAIASMVAAEGGLPRRLPIARDTAADLEARLAEALSADLILFSGGVSTGKYDLVEPILEKAGAEFFFTGAQIQPGKPVVFGRLPRGSRTSQTNTAETPGWTYFFGLPGNPVSTEVCFRLFVVPLLRALAGGADRAPRFSEATLAEDIRGGARVTRFLPGIMESAWDAVTVRPVPWQGSGDLTANARANVFVVLPAALASFAAGDHVRVLLR